MNSLPNLLSESACGSHKLYHIFWVTEIGGCDMAQMNLGEWAIAVHGMYESLWFNEFLFGMSLVKSSFPTDTGGNDPFVWIEKFSTFVTWQTVVDIKCTHIY